MDWLDEIAEFELAATPIVLSMLVVSAFAFSLAAAINHSFESSSTTTWLFKQNPTIPRTRTGRKRRLNVLFGRLYFVWRPFAWVCRQIAMIRRQIWTCRSRIRSISSDGLSKSVAQVYHEGLAHWHTRFVFFLAKKFWFGRSAQDSVDRLVRDANFRVLIPAFPLSKWKFVAYVGSLQNFSLVLGIEPWLLVLWIWATRRFSLVNFWLAPTRFLIQLMIVQFVAHEGIHLLDEVSSKALTKEHAFVAGGEGGQSGYFSLWLRSESLALSFGFLIPLLALLFPLSGLLFGLIVLRLNGLC